MSKLSVASIKSDAKIKMRLFNSLYDDTNSLINVKYANSTYDVVMNIDSKDYVLAQSDTEYVAYSIVYGLLACLADCAPSLSEDMARVECANINLIYEMRKVITADF